MLCVFFFFKQKTAYEMRISDWSSDVCSSDLTSSEVVPITKGQTYQQTQNEAETQAVYAFDSITIAEPLILNLGVRYDHYNTTVISATSGVGVPVAPIERSDDLFNWQAGLIFKPTANRSEEHTSELQSLMRISYAVFRLKKTPTTP